MSDRIYKNGDVVLINKFWTIEGGGQMIEGKTIEAVVISAEKTHTLGWTYKLDAQRPLSICYCENDIIGLAKEVDPDFIWKIWGDY